MLTSEKIHIIQQQGQTTVAEALALFDELDPVDLDFMVGRWRGSELLTGHPMDGLLEVSNWYGKEFVDPDHVHPLLFLDSSGQIIRVAPNSLVMNLALNAPIPRDDTLKPVYTFLTSLQKTHQSKARLRMVEHRQKVSATMIYDDLPIHDVFRKIDDHTVLGLMDYKAAKQPYFFVLSR
ncbi:MAG: DUF4334 domain-containing protein [Thainema sp.]